MSTTYTVEACTDCLLVAANGETDNEIDPEPLGLLEGLEVVAWLAWDEHTCERHDKGEPVYDCGCENLGFSWRDCEGCGSPLGGDRYALTVWTRV